MIEILNKPWIKANKLKVEPDAKQWLTFAGSSTELMKHLSNNHLKIIIVNQSWEVPSHEESEYLQTREDETVFIREIFMQGNDEKWMFCRTLFPRKALTGEDQAFTKLDTLSLGSVIYKDNKWQRSEFEFHQVSRGDHLFDQAQTNENNLWARRSHFSCGQKKILVQEVFLPDLFKHSDGLRKFIDERLS